jgi:hypothetical protein
VEGRAGHRREARDRGVLQAERLEDPFVHQRADRLPGHLRDDLTQERVVGVRVAEAGPRFAGGWPRQRVGEQFVRGPLPERVCVEELDEGRLALGPVLVAGGVVGEHPQGDAVGVREARAELRELVVEREPAFVFELQQQGDQLGDRHRAEAEVHVGRGRDAGHRAPEPLIDQRVGTGVDAQQRRLEAERRHLFADINVVSTLLMLMTLALFAFAFIVGIRAERRRARRAASLLDTVG